MKRLGYTLMVMLLFIIGCTKEENKGENEGYNPLAVGNEWTYQKDEGTQLLMNTSQVKMKVVEKIQVGNEEGYKLEVVEDGDTNYIYAVMEGENLVWYEDEEGEEPIYEEPEDLEIGERWNSRVTINAQGNKLEVIDTCYAEGEEEVTVPAGTFTALKIVCKSSTEIGDTLNLWKVNEEKILYKVKGIGEIKRVVNEEILNIMLNDTTFHVEESYTWELQEYNISEDEKEED